MGAGLVMDGACKTSRLWPADKRRSDFARPNIFPGDASSSLSRR